MKHLITLLLLSFSLFSWSQKEKCVQSCCSHKTTAAIDTIGKAFFELNKGKLQPPIKKGKKTILQIFDTTGKLAETDSSTLVFTYKTDTMVYAIAEGVVVAIMNYSEGGKVLVVKQGPYFMVYRNIYYTNKNRGDTIQTRESIALLSPANKSTSLEFQLWENKIPLCPYYWFKD